PARSLGRAAAPRDAPGRTLEPGAPAARLVGLAGRGPHPRPHRQPRLLPAGDGRAPPEGAPERRTRSHGAALVDRPRYTLARASGAAAGGRRARGGVAHHTTACSSAMATTRFTVHACSTSAPSASVASAVLPVLSVSVTRRAPSLEQVTSTRRPTARIGPFRRPRDDWPTFECGRKGRRGMLIVPPAAWSRRQPRGGLPGARRSRE